MKKEIDMVAIEKRYSFYINQLKYDEEWREKQIKGSNSYYNRSSTIAEDYFNLGQYSYILNNPINARSFFLKSYENFSIYNVYDPGGKRESGTYIVLPLKMIETTIFSGKHELRKRCADELLTNKIDIVPNEINPFYYEIKMILFYFLNQLNDISYFYPTIDEHEKKMLNSDFWQGEDVFHGRAMMMEGILTTTPDIFYKGCFNGLNRFSNIYKRQKDTMTPLCTSVLKYLFLAKEMKLNVEPDRIPENLRIFISKFFEYD
jgi:hypothetical protein